jgi:hypothetical protein
VQEERVESEGGDVLDIIMGYIKLATAAALHNTLFSSINGELLIEKLMRSVENPEEG